MGELDIINIEGPVGRCGMRSINNWSVRGPPRAYLDPQFDRPCDNVLIETTIEELVSTPFFICPITPNSIVNRLQLTHGDQPQIATARHNKFVTARGPQPPDRTHAHFMLATFDPYSNLPASVSMSIDNGGDREQYAYGGTFNPVTPCQRQHRVVAFQPQIEAVTFKFTFRLDDTPTRHPAPPLDPVSRIQLDEPIPEQHEWMDSVMVKVWQDTQARFVTLHFRIMDLDENSSPEDSRGFYQPILYDITNILAESEIQRGYVRDIPYVITLRRLSAPLPAWGESVFSASPVDELGNGSQPFPQQYFEPFAPHASIDFAQNSPRENPEDEEPRIGVFTRRMAAASRKAP